MFALLNLDEEASINLKCDPQKALDLRERYPSVLPGYHMNKKYWNTVLLDGSLSDDLLTSLIDHSYHEVLKKLPLKKQQQLSKE